MVLSVEVRSSTTTSNEFTDGCLRLQAAMASKESHSFEAILSGGFLKGMKANSNGKSTDKSSGKQ